MNHITQGDALKKIRANLGRYATLVEYTKIGTIRTGLEIVVTVTDDRDEHDGTEVITRRITIFDGDKQIMQGILMTTTVTKEKHHGK